MRTEVQTEWSIKNESLLNANILANKLFRIYLDNIDVNNKPRMRTGD